MTVNYIESVRDEVFASVNIKLRSDDNRHTALRAKLDTGAQGNLLPLRVYRRMYPQNLTAEGYPKPIILAKSTAVLSAYGGTQLTQHGICKIPCEFKGKKSVASFFVTEAEGPAIIGLQTSLELNLVTLNCSVQKKSTPDGKSTATTVNCIDNKSDLTASYPECFDGVGKFQGQYHITINPSVPPVVHAQRRVPLSLRDDIKAELTAMENKGIIAKLKKDEPTAWANSLVYRRKPNG